MKKFGIVAFLCLVTNVLTAQYDNAGQYLDAIGQQYKSIQKEMWEYTSAASHGKNAKTVEKKRITLIETTYSAKGNVKSMKGFNDNTSYRDSVVSFLNIYYLVLKEDYAKIVNMEEIAERSYDAMEAYMMAKEEASKKLADASEMLANEQKKFAEEFDVELLAADDDLSRKMKVAEEVYDYYNVVYLVFFKSYIQDIYLSEAINKGDISAIEQNRSALSGTSKEGLNKLNDVSPFKGDNSLVEACRDLLKYYQDKADKQIEHITNYYIKAENFKTIQTSFEQKKERDRTQEDIDQFNNAVNESNAAAQKYNEANAYMSKYGAAKIDGWNKSVERFTDKHVPN